MFKRIVDNQKQGKKVYIDLELPEKEVYLTNRKSYKSLTPRRENNHTFHTTKREFTKRFPALKSFYKTNNKWKEFQKLLATRNVRSDTQTTKTRTRTRTHGNLSVITAKQKTVANMKQRRQSVMVG